MKMREIVFGRQLDGGLQCRFRNIHAIHVDGIEGDERINLGIVLLQLQAALQNLDRFQVLVLFEENLRFKEERLIRLARPGGGFFQFLAGFDQAIAVDESFHCLEQWVAGFLRGSRGN